MANRWTHRLGALIVIPLGACSSVEAAPPAMPAADLCLPAKLIRFHGQVATSDLAARMLAATRKTALRWVQPGTMVTMDFREDRLTVYLDSANRVERASCS